MQDKTADQLGIVQKSYVQFRGDAVPCFDASSKILLILGLRIESESGPSRSFASLFSLSIPTAARYQRKEAQWQGLLRMLWI